MKLTFQILCLCSLVLFFSAYALWAMGYPSASWRYKITVELETPEGAKSGFAVRALKFKSEPKIFPEQPGFNLSTRGEAVAVDIGERGVVFALVSDVMTYAFSNPYNHLGNVQDYKKYIAFYNDLEIGQEAVLPKKHWPKFVMFEDIDDPISIKLVYGDEYNKTAQKSIVVDRTQDIFGEGVQVNKIVVTRTRSRITKVMHEKLPWFSELRKQKQRLNRKTGAIKTNELSDNLGTGAFSRN